MTVDASGARILIGQFLLEANSFAPGSTALKDFEPAGLYIGDAFRREMLPETGELTAGWDILAGAGAELVPTIRALAVARPPLTVESWVKIREAILSRADDSIDGVFLSLHGASLAHGVDDPEGELLGLLRKRLRPGVPVAISLDCHAGWTAAMEKGCDIATAYQTVPHTDMSRTGAQAASLLLRTMRGEIRPVVRSARIAMVAPADRQDVADPTFGRLMGIAHSAERQPGILAAAFLPSHPWRDVPELCWGAIATADGDAAAAERVTGEIADEVWAYRHWFTRGTRFTMAVALQQALEGPPPVVIADAGDSPTGGALGDSTELLRVATRFPGRRIWMAVTDAPATKRARDAGIGNRISLSIGSGALGSYNAKTEIEADVLGLPDGHFTYLGPYARGVTADLGDAALVGIGEVRIILHARQVLEFDPSPFIAAGLDPVAAEVLQAKSHVTYRAGYAHVTDRFVVADTPGPTAADLTLLPYQRRPTPLFPFEDPSMRDGGRHR
jgi:microcystin degradation protein MlrC